MHVRPRDLLLASLLALLTGCGGTLNQTLITCPAGRTLLDGVCVSEGVADYVACVRAQGAQLGGSKTQQISAEAGTVGMRAQTAAEVSETLQRKYAVSDAATLEVIRRCSSISAPTAPPGPGKAVEVPVVQPPPVPKPAPAAPQRRAVLYKGSGPAVYLASGGVRRHIPDPDTFNAMGQEWGAIQSIDDATLAGIPDAGPLPRLSEGALVKGSGPAVYRLNQRTRRWIPDPDTFNAMGLQWGAILAVPDEALEAIPQGPQYPSVQR